MYLPVHFGYSAAGEIVSDLAEIVNLIIAGHPKAGKSNFLHTLAVELQMSRQVWMAIIDLKRVEYSYLQKHAVIAIELPDALRILMSINQHINRRLCILEQAEVVQIQEYHELPDYQGDMPFIVLIIDELAEMQDEACQDQLNRIVRIGRAAGVCAVVATQRPSSTMFKKFGDSKAMFSGTMCFHVRDEVNSRMLLDNDKASIIPNIKGRAIYQWDREIEVQTMHLPVKQARKIMKDIEGVNKIVVEPQKRLLP
jgi:S-DNA-T family DNA segregation ATPase FtsK/SpoIIIE